MKQDTSQDGPIVMVPTLADVEGVKVGSCVLDSMGRLSVVVRVAYRGVDIKGAPFVGFDTRFGDNATLSGSYKVGELCRTVHLCAHHNSAALDKIEHDIRIARGLPSKRLQWIPTVGGRS